MSPARFTVIPAAYVILRRDSKVLLIRRKGTGYFDGYYGLPSGHIDGNEPADLAARREALEEVGVTISADDLRFVHVMHRIAEEGGQERVDFGFCTEKWQGEPYNAEPEKCDDIQWYELTALPENTVPVVKVLLEHIANGIYYSHHNFSQHKIPSENVV